ncbi:MAG: hypothetical protein AAGD10_08885 [Myxococcota bacterium]
MTERLPVLDRLQIATPCHAKWADMAGDDRRRFCGGCQKHVYNFAVMTAEESVDLIHRTEGRLCVRLFRRADGTILTADCPVGLRARLKWARHRTWATAAAIVTSLAAGVHRLSNSSEAVESKEATRFETPPVLMGAPEPFGLMGDIAVPELEIEEIGEIEAPTAH